MTEKKFRVGDRVRFQRWPNSFAEGVVSEDRGPIGRGGRRLYGIIYSMGLHVEEPAYTERPAEDLELVPATAPAK